MRVQTPHVHHVSKAAMRGNGWWGTNFRSAHDRDNSECHHPVRPQARGFPAETLILSHLHVYRSEIL